MNPQYEAIFQKALASMNPKAIFEVARAFEGIMDPVKAWQLYQRAYGLGQAFAFGMSGEKRSVADLLDIVAAKDAAMINLANRVIEVFKKPEYVSSGTRDAYNALVDRYGKARDRAQKAIDNANSIIHIMPLALTDATAEYEGLLDVLNSHWREMTWTPGDWSLEDVYARVSALGAKGIQDINTPQPMAIDTLQVLNATTRAMENAAKGIGEGIGTLAEQASKGAAMGLGPFATKLAMIGGGALVALILLKKVLPI